MAAPTREKTTNICVDHTRSTFEGEYHHRSRRIRTYPWQHEKLIQLAWDDASMQLCNLLSYAVEVTRSTRVPKSQPKFQ